MTSKTFEVFMILLQPVVLTNCLPLTALAFTCSSSAGGDPNSFNSCERSTNSVDILLATALSALLFVSMLLLLFTTQNRNVFQQFTKNISRGNILMRCSHKILIAFVFLPYKTREMRTASQILNMLFFGGYVYLDCKTKAHGRLLYEIADMFALVLLFYTSFAAFIADLSSQTYTDLIIHFAILLLIVFSIYIIRLIKSRADAIVVMQEVTSQNASVVLQNLNFLVRIAEMGSSQEKFYLHTVLVHTLRKWSGSQLQSGDSNIALPPYFYKEPSEKVRLGILNDSLVRALYRYLVMVIDKCERLPHCNRNPFYFLQIYFLCYKIKDYKTALWVLVKSVRNEEVRQSVFYRFEKSKVIACIEDYVRTVDSAVGKVASKATIPAFIIFEFNRLQFVRHLQLALEDAKLMLKELVLRLPDMKKLMSRIERLKHNYGMASGIIDELANSEILPKAIFRLYDAFVRNVIYDRHRSARLQLASSGSLETKLCRVADFDPYSCQISIEKEQFFFIVSVEPDSFGEIKYASQDVFKVLKLETSSLLNTLFELLKPSILREDFRHFKRFLNTDSLFAAFDKMPVFLDFYLDSNGFTVVAATKVAFFQNLGKGMNLFILSTPLKPEDEGSEGCLVMSTFSGQVHGFTKNFSKMFSISPSVSFKSSYADEPKIFVHDFFSNLRDDLFKELLSGKVVTAFYDQKMEILKSNKTMVRHDSHSEDQLADSYSIHILPPDKQDDDLDAFVGQTQIDDFIEMRNVGIFSKAKILKTFSLNGQTVSIVRFRSGKSKKTNFGVPSGIQLPAQDNMASLVPESVDIDQIKTSKPTYLFNSKRILVKLRLIVVIFAALLVSKIAFAGYLMRAYQTELTLFNHRMLEKIVITRKVIYISKLLFRMQLASPQCRESTVVDPRMWEARRGDIQFFVKSLKESELEFAKITNEIYLDHSAFVKEIFSSDTIEADSAINLGENGYFANAYDQIEGNYTLPVSFYDFTFLLMSDSNKFLDSYDLGTIQKSKEILEQFYVLLQPRFELDDAGHASQSSSFFTGIVFVRLAESALFVLFVACFKSIATFLVVQLRKTYYMFSCISKPDLSILMSKLNEVDAKIEQGLRQLGYESQTSKVLDKGLGRRKSQFGQGDSKGESIDFSDEVSQNKAKTFSQSSINYEAQPMKAGFDHEEKAVLLQPDAKMSKRYRSASKQSLIPLCKLCVQILLSIGIFAGLQVGKFMLLQTVDSKMQEYKAHEDLFLNLAFSYHQIEFLTMLNSIDPDCDSCHARLESLYLNIFQQYKNLKAMLDVTGGYGLEEYYAEFARIISSFCDASTLSSGAELDFAKLCQDYPILAEGFEPVIFTQLDNYRALMHTANDNEKQCQLLWSDPLGDVITHSFRSILEILKAGIEVGLASCFRGVYVYQLLFDLATLIALSLFFVLYYFEIRDGTENNELICNILTNSGLASNGFIAQELKGKRLVVEVDNSS